MCVFEEEKKEEENHPSVNIFQQSTTFFYFSIHMCAFFFFLLRRFALAYRFSIGCIFLLFFIVGWVLSKFLVCFSALCDILSGTPALNCTY